MATMKAKQKIIYLVLLVGIFLISWMVGFRFFFHYEFYEVELLNPFDSRVFRLMELARRVAPVVVAPVLLFSKKKTVVLLVLLGQTVVHLGVLLQLLLINYMNQTDLVEIYRLESVIPQTILGIDDGYWLMSGDWLSAVVLIVIVVSLEWKSKSGLKCE